MSKSTNENIIAAGTATGSVPVDGKYEYSPSTRPTRMLKKMPSIHRVDTYFNGSATIFPSSAHSASSITGSPSCSSYQGSPYFSTQFPNSLSTVETLHLPEPVVPPSISASAAYSSSFPRQNGLTRKLSSGKRALSRLGRTTSSGTPGRRDPSSGPVARRRSDSKTSTTAAFESEDSVPDVPNGLGLYHYSNPNSLEDTTLWNDLPIRSEKRAEVMAPCVPATLVAGSTLTKITKRKCQEKVFFLDRDGSTVSWMGTVKVKSFEIDNVKSIRPGPEGASYWADLAGPYFEPSRYFTINYASSQSSKDIKTLHLLAPTEELQRLWIKTLEALSKHREELMSELAGTERESVLRTHWQSVLAWQQQQNGMSNVHGLDLHTVVELCRKLHIHCPRYIIEDGFNAADTKSAGLLDFEQFKAFVRRLRSRVDLRPLFNQLKSVGLDGVTRDDFLHFLKHEQGIDVDANYTYWVERFETLAAKSHSAATDNEHQSHLDFASFTSFLISKDCHVHAPTRKQKTTLDRPLNEYFISSSHNTYLVGRQVTGTSSIEPYVTALRKGCRSVEIDCWDGENNNPRVTHGFTGTTSIPFVEVIRAINRCAFEASPYPVILSLEVHCNPIQQARMVEIMKDCFEPGRLLLYPLPDHTLDLPSPEELKYKVLVKVKATNPRPTLQLFTDALPTTRQRSTSSPVRRSGVLQTSLAVPVHHLVNSPPLATPPESIHSPTDQSMTPTSDDEYDGEGSSITSAPSAPTPGKTKTSKITQELAALGVYMQGYSYRAATDLKFTKFNHIFSVNENTAMDVSKNQDSKFPFEKHNISFLCRVYPRTTRFNSSNFDPNTFWRRGVQMVALNWQTYDIHMQMNQAMFAAGSDRTGYALKPVYLRNPARFEGMAEQKAKLPHYKINFSIKVISAQQLPRLSSLGKHDLISPFVEVQMFSAEDKARSIACGHGGEEVSRTNSYHGIGKPYSRRTKTVPENGYNPQFNDLIELSLETKYPELVFVRFVVYQSGKSSNKELAVFTAKLDSLQQGYRHLPLYNSNGEELIFSTLFCHINKQRPVTVERDGLPVRQGSIRKLLSRSNTTDRGRQRGQTLADLRS